MDPELRQEDIAEMATPVWQQAKDAMAAGDLERAAALVDRAAARTRSLQEYSVNWITSLLSFIGREMGEAAVERALRATGDEFVRPRREVAGAPAWGALPAASRAKAIARAMVANGGSCTVDEDDEKITLTFQCGSGGHLIDTGAYEDTTSAKPGYLVLRQRAGRTFQRDELPVYCAHCSVNNEIQPVEWGGTPTSIEHPPTRPGEPCVHHVYKDVTAIPDGAFERIGMSAPLRDQRPG